MPTSTADRIRALRVIPLFSCLSNDELLAAQGAFAEEEHRKGDLICRAGEEGDTFYIVLTGELEVWSSDEEPKLLSRLGPRDFFGEMALVLGGPRVATVRVSRQTRLLSLAKESFDRYFLGNTKVLEHFSRVLCQRLAASATNRVEEHTSQVIAVVAARETLRGATVLSASLASLLARFTDRPVVRLEVAPMSSSGDSTRRVELGADVGPVVDELHWPEPGPRGRRPAILRVGLRRGVDPQQAMDRLATLTTRLCRGFEFVVVDLGREPACLVSAVARWADRAVWLVDTPGQGRTAAGRGDAETARIPGPEDTDSRSSELRSYEVLNLHNRNTRRVPVNACEPFVLPADAIFDLGQQGAADADLELGDRVADAPGSSATLVLHRLVRKILGRTVGLALGGGAAFGLAHLGVLRVFEEHGLPVDMMAGCSFGSLVAIGYGSGISVARLEELATELGSKTRLLNLVRRDATLTRPGFLTGDGILETFAPFLQERRTFRHLTIPCRAVATDIETGERVAIGTGRLDEAFRASCSVPIVMAPVRRGDRVLVDGGVCDPVPAEVVREMGADITVAVNVVPPLERGVEMLPSRIYRRMSYLNPLAYLGQSLDLPNLFDIAMSSMQILQHELGNFKAITADIRINPDLSDFTWIEFYRDRELIARGAEAAETAVPAVRRALAGDAV